MRKFCVLRALLKGMILMKTIFLKSTILKKIFFLKSMILNKNFPVKSMIFKKKNFVLSDFEQKFFLLVRFYNNFSTTRQIRNNLPKSTTCTFHIAFLHITMYSYRLQYLDQLDNSIRRRSNNIFRTLFCNDFHF